MSSFGPSLYLPCEDLATLRASVLSNQTLQSNIGSTESIIETTLSPDLKVVDLNAIAVARIGRIIGRTLIAADWVSYALSTLRDYAPYSCVLDSRGKDNNEVKIYCQIFPLYVPPSLRDLPPHSRETSAGDLSPNRCFWVMTDCHSISTNQQIIYLLRDFVIRLRKRCELDLHTFRKPRSSNQNFLVLFTHLIDVVEPLLEQAIATDPTIEGMIDAMKSFLLWIDQVESELWSHQSVLEELAGLRDPKFPITPEPELHSNYTFAHQRHGGFTMDPKLRKFSNIVEASGPVIHVKADPVKTEEPKSDLLLTLSLSEEVERFFSAIRSSSICSHIIRLLTRTVSRDQSQVVEEFISYCFTKHTNPRVRYLMKYVQDLIHSHQLELAVSTLSEV
jgi:hypothetical protein